MRVGQHPRMVGQHKTEWWVNMEQNLQLQDLYYFLLALKNLIKQSI